MKYKFEQFNVELENPTITINFDSLIQKPANLTFSVEVFLQVNGAKYSHTFQDLTYVGVLTNSEVVEQVNNELLNFAI